MEQHWLDILVEWGQRNKVVTELHIFGSRARGDYTESSDLDVGVILTGDKNNNVLAIWMGESSEWKSELNLLVPVKIDLQLANIEDTEIVAAAINTDGIEIYKRESAL